MWDDDIPDYVRHYCDGYNVEYFGIYEGYDVYAVSFRSSDPLVGDDECIEGYPAFLLVARDGSGKAKQVSKRRRLQDLQRYFRPSTKAARGRSP